MKTNIRPFTQIDNQLINSRTLSIKAKGLYTYMKSKPKNWKFTIRSIASQLPEGKRSIGNALKELKEYGWIEFYRRPSGIGEYIIHTQPIGEFYESITHNVDQHNSTMLIPTSTQEHRISNIDHNNIDNNSNKEQNKQYQADIEIELRIFESLIELGFDDIESTKIINKNRGILILLEQACIEAKKSQKMDISDDQEAYFNGIINNILQKHIGE
ncbi:helix-turn-helix domain-containing protein [Francisella salimarina]|uniref:Helix-turn-helix domain-containing protein n=1 Tax=Francisella salimarina TaxID=2599927 RepID=A0AAJ4NMB7_9GAMM|nr:helix-turn-helix domain-containing protein [Francisella salimarina]QWU98528.1 helix-turn-helix domain-containing protein [Francisella salimarina]